MISRAQETDIPQLLKLINKAYRGDESKKGWTTEAELIDGDIRTDEEVLEKLIIRSGNAMLKYIEDNEVVGCVHIESKNNKLYVGMLSVSPEMQGKNIGKTMLRAAEEYAAANDKESVVMNVISLRHELISWYEKHGYLRTGETQPFPADNKFGTPKQPLEFVVLEKKINRWDYLR